MTSVARKTLADLIETLGIGSGPISVVRNHVEKLADLLGVLPGVFPMAGLCVGYPSQPGWISMRLPPAVTVHADGYHDGDLPAPLEADDRRREARHATPRESQRFADRFGYPRSPTGGRRTRRGSTRCPSATASAPSCAATASGWPEIVPAASGGARRSP